MNSTLRSPSRLAAWALGLGLLWCVVALAQDRGPSVTDGSRWIIEDIDAGYAEAQRSGKPLLVVFR